MKTFSLHTALIAIMMLVLTGCSGFSPSQPTPVAPLPTAQIVAPPDRAAQIAAIPTLANRRAQVAAALAADPPVLRLAGLDANQQRAQDLTLQDSRVLALLRSDTGMPLRNEVFGVYPLRESDITENARPCANHTCYRVELYHYANNKATLAIVDLNDTIVLDVVSPPAQPELPPHLADLAMQIALKAPEVAQALGTTPTNATMANTKTALKNSSCERAGHLCVAPTIILSDRALWAIVDLTDERLAGIAWTRLGRSIGEWPERPGIDKIRQDAVFNQYCKQNTQLEQEGWRLEYILTASDGLRIANVSFKGQPVLDSAKLVDWHVSYSTRQNFGYSDGVGCPAFSSSAVAAVGGPRVVPIQQNSQNIGFAIEQDYYHPLWPQPCNYRYQQRYEFYADGRFRPIATNLGRGCGNQGSYRPVLRIQPAGVLSVDQWDGKAWKRWQSEAWILQEPATPYTPEGYQFRLTNAQGYGFYIEPGRGQFNDGGRGDNAYTYMAVARSAEGEADLPTIGACCNTDYRQGPEAFVEPPESLNGQKLVLWYVPHMQNDDRPGQEYCWADLKVENGVYTPRSWPCSSGPMFVPTAPR